MTGLVDTHCHLYADPLGRDPTAVLDRAHSAGVQTVVVPGVDVQTSQAAIELAQNHTRVVVAVGYHPEEVVDDAPDLDALGSLLEDEHVVALGEVGLDATLGRSTLERQQAAFTAQLDLARAHELPVLIHCRGATGQVVDLLEKQPHPFGGIFHAFNGSAEIAQRLAALGFALGIGGVACRPSATRIRQMISRLDLAWLVLETDAPYIGTAKTPKGQVEPGDLPEICGALASLHNLAPDGVARATTQNARRILKRLP